MKAVGRWLLMALVWLLVWPRRRPRLAGNELKRILVVRIDPRVGNVLLTTPLLRALHGSGSERRTVEVLVAAGKERVIEGLEFVDRVHRFEKRDAFTRPWRLWRLIRTLRANGYDAAVDASHYHAFSFTSAWLTRSAKARFSVAHARGLARRFVDEVVPHPVSVVNEVDAKLELLGPLGIPAPPDRALATRLGLSAPGLEDLLTAQLPKERFVALNVGARKADHRWPPESFAELARRLRTQGLTALVLWGPGEEELARRVVELSEGAATLAPPTDLDGLAATFRVASAVVTNDTGPLHLAVAVGAPTVGCFLSGDAERWSHPGPRFRAVILRGEPDPVGAVERAVQSMLAPLALPPAVERILD